MRSASYGKPNLTKIYLIQNLIMLTNAVNILIVNISPMHKLK